MFNSITNLEFSTHPTHIICNILVGVAVLVSACDPPSDCAARAIPTGTFRAHRDSLIVKGNLLLEAPGKKPVTISLIAQYDFQATLHGWDVLNATFDAGEHAGWLTCSSDAPPIRRAKDAEIWDGETSAPDTVEEVDSATTAPSTDDKPAVHCKVTFSVTLDGNQFTAPPDGYPTSTIVAQTGPAIDGDLLSGGTTGSIVVRLSGSASLGTSVLNFDGVELHATYTWREVMRILYCA